MLLTRNALRILYTCGLAAMLACGTGLTSSAQEQAVSDMGLPLSSSLPVPATPGLPQQTPPDGPKMVPFDFNRQQGDWTIIGMKMPDGGFACSMSKLVDSQAFTLVTGLRANPVVTHQTLFAPTSIPEGTIVSVLVMLPSGLASPAFPVTVRSSSPPDAGVSPESQADGRTYHLIVSVDKETLKGIGIILGVEGTLSLRVMGQDGAELERLRFPLGGGMEAALLHADCVSSLYGTMNVSGQTPIPRPMPR